MKSAKEKMLAGQPYLANGSELVGERLLVKELLFEFNNLRPVEVEARNAILQKLFGKTGANFYVEPPFRCDYGYNIEIGDNFYANYNLVILDCASVKIGDNVFIAPNVGIYTAGHPIHSNLRNQELEFALPIEIGNSVWIGGNVVINPGIKIGDNTVIGSGSVVTKNIPPNVVAVGNPCKVLRSITEDDKSYYCNNFKGKKNNG
jgi:acetyltransferase-like isoleucine patch superfamily enzyme